MEALQEYYEENDGGGERMMKYSWNFFIKPFSFVKDCSECGAMGGARSSYRLCDNILDHGDLQVHLGLVQLLGALPHLYIATLPEKFLTIIKRNHMTSRKCYQEQIPQITNFYTVYPTLKHKQHYYHQAKSFCQKHFSHAMSNVTTQYQFSVN